MWWDIKTPGQSWFSNGTKALPGIYSVGDGLDKTPIISLDRLPSPLLEVGALSIHFKNRTTITYKNRPYRYACWYCKTYGKVSSSLLTIYKEERMETKPTKLKNLSVAYKLSEYNDSWSSNLAYYIFKECKGWILINLLRNHPRNFSLLAQSFLLLKTYRRTVLFLLGAGSKFETTSSLRLKPFRGYNSSPFNWSVFRMGRPRCNLLSAVSGFGFYCLVIAADERERPIKLRLVGCN